MRGYFIKSITCEEYHILAFAIMYPKDYVGSEISLVLYFSCLRFKSCPGGVAHTSVILSMWTLIYLL